MPITTEEVAFANAMSARDENRQLRQDVDELNARVEALTTIVKSLASALEAMMRGQ